MRRSYSLIISFLFVEILYSQAPRPRASAQLFYNKANKSLLLLDGYDAGIGSTDGKSEIFEWKDGKWKLINNNDQPLRSLSAAAYMTDKDGILVYGGIGSRGYDDSLRSTYFFHNNTWKTIPDNSIGTHDHHEMVYDELNKMIVVYGGQTGNRNFDTKTWLFQDEKWIPLNISSPGPRVHHAMAYDANRNKIVLYGGSADKGSFDETWEFDGTA